MAGLSVAFDASLRGDVAGLGARRAAWCPAPRSLVRSGDGPRAVAGRQRHHGRLDGADAGGAVADRVAGRRTPADPRRRGLPARARRPGSSAADREVWNTYGPTEATVVACGARLDRAGAGADRAAAGRLGPRRRRRSRVQPVGAGRGRRADHRRRRAGPLPRPGQGRREVRPDARRSAGTAPTAAATWSANDAGGPGVRRAAPTTRSSSAAAGSSSARSTARCSPLPGRDRCRGRGAQHRRRQPAPRRVRRRPTTAFDPAVADRPAPRRRCPAALVPRLAAGRRRCRRGPPARSTATRCPWPLRDAGAPERQPARARRHGGLARGRCGCEVLGAVVTAEDDDFFDLGGGSLTAAQLVSRLRERFPEVTVADVYEHPTVAAPGRRARRDGRARGPRRTAGSARPRARRRSARSLLTVPLRTALRAALADLGRGRATTSPPALLGLDLAARACRGGGWARLAAARAVRPGRMLLAAAGARLLLRGVGPGELPARRQDAPAALAGRAAGRRAGRGQPGRRAVDAPLRAAARRRGRRATSTCTAIPPVTGLLTLGDGCSIEPEVDLTRALARRRRAAPRAGRGRRRAPASARAARCCPGADVGRGRRGRARARPCSAPSPRGEYWSGVAGASAAASPGARGPTQRPATSRAWIAGVRRDRGGASRCCRCSRRRRRPRGRRRRLRGGRPRSGRGARGPLRAGCRSARVGRAGRCSPCSSLAAGPAARGCGLVERPPPGPQPARAGRRGRRCGCSTRPAPGCSRSTPAR